MKRLVAALGLLLALASQAGAANSVVYDSIATFATYHNISLKVYYHGDDDSDMTVSAGVTGSGVAPAGGLDTLTWYRSTKFGANQSVSTDTKTYWASSINMCGADSAFDVYVNVADADGCTSCPTDFTAKVTPTTSPRTTVNNTTARLTGLAMGKQVWMSTRGSDLNTGLDRTSPVATFAKAVSLMTTQGDQLRLLGTGGATTTYYTMRTDSLYVSPDSKNGTGSKYYSVVGDTVGITISGADTTALSGLLWTAVDIGITGPVRYAYVHNFSAKPTWPRAVVIGDSLRLYPYKKLADLRTDPLHVVSASGAYWFSGDGKVLYIRPPDKVLPIGEVLGGLLADAADLAWLKGGVRVSTKDEAFRIESAFWRVDSLTFKDFGVGNDLAYAYGVVNMSNQGGVVENCRFEDNGRAAVALRFYFDGTQFRTHSQTIQNNTFISHTLGQTWDGPSNHFLGFDKMAGTFASCTVQDTTCPEMMVVFPATLIETGRGHVIRWNKFNGGGDAMVRFSSTAVDTSQAAVNSVDIYQNQMLNLGDDNIEPDACSGVNVRIYKNMILGGHTAMNWNIIRGPMWFMFNTCINQYDALLPSQVVSAGIIPKGHVVIANNTFASRSVPASDLWSSSQSSSYNSYVNAHVINNIFASAGPRTIWEGGCKGLNEFNWNNHHRFTDSTFNAAVAYTSSGHDVTTLQTWRDSCGCGANDGRSTSLQFSDSTNWDWAPKSTWSQVLGGLNARSLPGVNTNTIHHMSPAWKVNTSGSSDSTYVGAWKINGYRLETLGSGVTPPTSGTFRRRPHKTAEEAPSRWAEE